MKLFILGHRNAGKKTLAAYIRDNIDEIEPILPDESEIEHAHYDVYTPVSLKSDGTESAVILVNSLDGPMPGTRAAIVFCKENNILICGVIITKTDEFEKLSESEPLKYTKSLMKMIEIEALELISSYDIDDTAIPVLRANLIGDMSQIEDFLRKQI